MEQSYIFNIEHNLNETDFRQAVATSDKRLVFYENILQSNQIFFAKTPESLAPPALHLSIHYVIRRNVINVT